jgi:hypothetical protein
MVQRRCRLAIIFLLLFASTVLANTDVVVIIQPSTNCPAYYASAVLSWDGDHASGVLNACDSVGDAVLLTDSGSDISTYGENGSNAMKIDAKGEGVQLTQSAQQYFDETGPQTLCFKTYVSAQLDNDRVFLFMSEEDEETNDGVWMFMNGDATESAAGDYQTEGDDASAYGLPLTYASWIVIAYSFDRPGTADGDHSANPGDQGTWADGWEDDDTELDSLSMTESPVRLIFGSSDIAASNAPGDTEYYYIDEWAIVGSYKFDCSTIF